MKVILCPNPYRDHGLKAAQTADKILRSSGVETKLCLPFQTDSGFELPRQLVYSDIRREVKNADMIVCFGGDGTILHAAKDAQPNSIPILGVNLGSVGFMAELESSELNLLRKLAAGKYSIESRVMLDVKVFHEGKAVYEDTALNDAVVTKGAVARMIDLTVYADKVQMSDFAGDGLVLSTPTGSTAYSLAAGGPIVEPTAENIIVTPVCAHTLHAKPFVLDRSRVVTAKMSKQSRKTAYLSVDGGKAIRMTAGDTVEVRISKQSTWLVRLTNRSFYELVNRKLGKM